MKGNIAGKHGRMRGDQQNIIERQGFFDDFHVLDSDKISIIREPVLRSKNDGDDSDACQVLRRTTGAILNHAEHRETRETAWSFLCGLRRSSRYRARQCTWLFGRPVTDAELPVKSGAQYPPLVDAAGVCDYLSENRRSFRANPLTINILLTVLSDRQADIRSRFPRGSLLAAATMGLLGIVGGCVAPEPPKAGAVAPAAVSPVANPTALTAEADSALKAAEQSVIEARVKRALWTAAVEHLNKARAAAQVFNSTGTLEHAKEVVLLCELSIKQTALPPVKW
jgi:hypothetical protein